MNRHCRAAAGYLHHVACADPPLVLRCAGVVQVASKDSKSVFYWALAPMVAFYAFFAAVLLPNADKIQPVALATKYCATLVSSHFVQPMSLVCKCLQHV